MSVINRARADFRRRSLLGAAQIDRCSRSGRYQFAARIVDDHVVRLVGDEPRAALEDLLKTCATPVAKRGAEHRSYFSGLDRRGIGKRCTISAAGSGI